MAPAQPIADDLDDGLEYDVQFSDAETPLQEELSLEENTEVISEYINGKIRRRNPNLSALELTGLYFNKNEIRSTSDFKDTRNLDNLAKFVTARFKNMSSIKLINKNKLHVDLKLVKSTRSRVLCCTPGRLVKVLNSEDSELSKDEIKIVIVDNSYLDTKKQNIWDIQETLKR
ncbi:Protein CMS1 [Candida viswanathii]|uniref:Protein CMS1 n=1 Tax=Candida viswanathii TaxID=5486 RepID=A0A367XS52_9ASCO|nr:Protein CMS1 [Candida viswanathii]